MPDDGWAYDFASRLSLDAIRATFNATGPWQWSGVDSDRYGDYLVSRPEPYLELSIHVYPGIGLVRFTGLRWLGGYKAQLGLYSGSMATRPEVDAIFRRLLGAIRAEKVTEVEPFF